MDYRSSKVGIVSTPAKDIAYPATDIAYLVSHGFAARMLTQTDLLGELRRAGRRVALICPDDEDPNLRAYCQQAGVELYRFDPVSRYWTEEYFTARRYLLEDIDANPALLEKHRRAIRSYQGRNPWKWLRPYAYYGLHRLKKHLPSISRWYAAREQKHLDQPAARALLDRIDPATVVSTYPVNFSEAMLLHAAKKRGSLTVIHLLSWDNITAKGRFPQPADHYLAWGPIMVEELATNYGVADDRVEQCGVPHFDVHARVREKPEPTKYLMEMGLDPTRPYLFFGMSSPRFAPREIEIVEWMARQIEQDRFGPRLQLVVRPHPQNVSGSMADPTWLPRLEALAGPRLAVDYPELRQSKMPWSMTSRDMERMSHLLAGARICFNSGSTLSIDALMVDTPVVLTSFDGAARLPYWQSARRLIDYVHLQKLVDLGGVRITNDFTSLADIISRFLAVPDYLFPERRASRDRQIGFSDGSATQRVVAALLQKMPDAREVSPYRDERLDTP